MEKHFFEGFNKKPFGLRVWRFMNLTHPKLGKAWGILKDITLAGFVLIVLWSYMVLLYAVMG